MAGLEGKDRSEGGGLPTFAVGLTGLYFIIKSLSNLPGAVSWVLYLQQSESSDDAVLSLTTSIVSVLATFIVMLVAGSVLVWKRQQIGCFLSNGSSMERIGDGAKLVRPLVGLVGIWFLVTGMTAFLSTVMRDAQGLMTTPYYVAYGLQALTGLFLLVAHKSIARFLTAD